jgi:hypothetical protein
MSRTKLLFVLSIVILFAVVAVFSGCIHVPSLSAGMQFLPTAHSGSLGTLTADGGAPQPQPSPLPWRGLTA